METRAIHGNVFKILISIMAVLGLCLMSAPMASAAEETSTGLTPAQQAEFESGLETLFTTYVVLDGDTYVVNEDAAQRDGYAGSITDFHTVADALNMAGHYRLPSEVESAPSTGTGDIATFRFNAGDFAKCLVGSVLGIPVSAFGAGTWSAIVTAIKAWNWGLAAKTIARALGPAFLKGAGKYLGGPAVIAATLAGGAAVCAWQSR